MSDGIKSSEQNPALAKTPKGLNYRAVIDPEKCTVSGECIKVCEVNAIDEGPKRLPSMTCFAMELLPGKSEVDQEKCNGCGECVSVCHSNAIEMVPAA